MLELVIVGQLSARLDVLRGKDADADLARGRVVPLLRLAVGRARGVYEARHIPPARQRDSHSLHVHPECSYSCKVLFIAHYEAKSGWDTSARAFSVLMVCCYRSKMKVQQERT